MENSGFRKIKCSECGHVLFFVLLTSLCHCFVLHLISKHLKHIIIMCPRFRCSTHGVQSSLKGFFFVFFYTFLATNRMWQSDWLAALLCSRLQHENKQCDTMSFSKQNILPLDWKKQNSILPLKDLKDFCLKQLVGCKWNVIGCWLFAYRKRAVISHPPCHSNCLYLWKWEFLGHISGQFFGFWDETYAN